MLNAEQARQEAIERYGIARLIHDPGLDDVARLAAQICGTPVAAVTLLAEEHLAHLGRDDLKLRWTPWQVSPCKTTVDANGPHQIPDAHLHPLYAKTGISLDGRAYRFYAGVPIHAPDGIGIGSLCVMDFMPRRLDPRQLSALTSLSHLASARIEALAHIRDAEHAATTRQFVEAALIEEKNFVAAVLDTVGALVVVFDAEGRIVRFNRYCELLSGYSASDVIGTHAWDKLIPQADVAAYREQFDRARMGEFPVAFEDDWLAADGTRRRISWSTTALTNARADVSYIITTGIDVTVQNEAETAIRDSERRYREIVEGSLGLVCTHDLQGKFLSINEQGAQGLGRDVMDLVGQNLGILISPRFQAELQPYLQALLVTGEAKGLLHLQHRNGELRVLAYKNRLVRLSDTPLHALVFAVDITEQVNAEEQIRRLNSQSNSVLESIGDGVYGIDLEGRVTVVNPAGAKMLGYRPEELIGQNMHQLVHHSYPDGTPLPEADCLIRRSLSHLTPLRAASEVFWRKDGTSFPVEYVACPQIEHDTSSSAPGAGYAESPGRAVGVVVAFTDISERNALDRMKDEFISTVSHELRTPLTSLRAALGLVAAGRLSGDPDRTQQMMDIAVESTDRLVRLVNDILDLERIHSGKADMHFGVCAIDDLFGRAVALLQSAARRAGVRLVLEPSGVSVWADPDRLLQTLTNLVSNAIKFAPDERESETTVTLTARLASPGEAHLEVRDHGRGIPANQLQTIFERFKQIDASDSRAMGGTGLGLAICRSIVAQHGGSIWATSTLGEGSTFHILLPTQSGRSLR